MVYIYEMVTHYMLRTHEGKNDFSGKNIRSVTSLVLIKALYRSNNRDCTPIYELPSMISTIRLTKHNVTLSLHYLDKIKHSREIQIRIRTSRKLGSGAE